MLGGSLISGIFGAQSADHAADAQSDAAHEANALQRYMFNKTIDLNSQARHKGNNALDALAYEAGIGHKPDDHYKGFEASPGYQFRLDQGNQAIERMAAARGMRLSGATLKAADNYNQGMASNEYGNYLNQLSSLAGRGQIATQADTSAGQNYANAFGQNTMAAGQAQASGYAGVNNAFQGTMNNMFSGAGMAQSGMFGANPGFGIKPSPAGLSAWGF